MESYISRGSEGREGETGGEGADAWAKVVKRWLRCLRVTLV